MKRRMTDCWPEKSTTRQPLYCGNNRSISRGRKPKI